MPYIKKAEFERLMQADKMVKEVSEFDLTDSGTYHDYCDYCMVMLLPEHMSDHTKHEKDCLWRRAVEYKEQSA